MAESGKFYNVQLADQSASGKVYKVRDVTDEKNVSGKVYQVKGLGGGGGGGAQINNQDINVTQNGIYQAEEGYTGLGTVNVNVASGSPTQKFGASIDTFLGDVDADGNYVAPSEPVEINLAGVKSVDSYSFYYKFTNIGTLKVIANDITNVGNHAFSSCFSVMNTSIDKSIEIQFDNLEQIEGDSVFRGALANRITMFGKNHSIRFLKLKKISGHSCFQTFAQDLQLVVDDVFPALEEISGNSVMHNLCRITESSVMTWSKVKKITGSTKYQSVFGGVNAQNTVWNFPSATEMTGYIWNTAASYAGEIHFAAANQAAIEACEGYDSKWGFAGATVYFDL